MAAVCSMSSCMGSAGTVMAGDMEQSLENTTTNSICRSLKYLPNVIAYWSVSEDNTPKEEAKVPSCNEELCPTS